MNTPANSTHSYMQNNPNALSSFQPLEEWSDPGFEDCFLPTCAKTYGLMIQNSTYIFNYGAGLYSFFNNYDSGCITTTNCQQYMVSIKGSEAVYLFGLNTVAAQTLVEVDGVSLVPEGANVNTFCRTVALFEYP
jgi:glucan 1,3-beta-glucosidase